MTGRAIRIFIIAAVALASASAGLFAQAPAENADASLSKKHFI
jgi:hypothetical protein